MHLRRSKLRSLLKGLVVCAETIWNFPREKCSRYRLLITTSFFYSLTLRIATAVAVAHAAEDEERELFSTLCSRLSLRVVTVIDERCPFRFSRLSCSLNLHSTLSLRAPYGRRPDLLHGEQSEVQFMQTRINLRLTSLTILSIGKLTCTRNSTEY